ncbi:MAG: DEAD/DEAH box helicase family protein [Clostridia bacterium]|nr:DEAD/DEAH box helicase family protein [Clostridia bacterium]
MPDIQFFPQRPSSHPIIYAYSDTRFPGCLKVGYTARTIEERMKEHYPTITPSISYRVELVESAMYADGGSFTDHDVHRMLEKKGVPVVAGEWYKCGADVVRASVIAVRNHTLNEENRTQTFKMRPEQMKAVSDTVAYFKSAEKEGAGRIPKFLWNAKMRFGKTFASYQLAKKLGYKRVLILTFKPAVETAWREDLMTHVDFEGWQFISRPVNYGDPGMDEQYKRADKDKPIVCFGSFQDFMGVNKETGGIKANNEWVHATNWDLVIFDEYHFGAWRDNAKKLFDSDEDTYEEDLKDYDRADAVDETWLPITTDHYLYLSGTPFRALNSGEFIEEQIFNWTYSDEQRAKAEWPHLSQFPDYVPGEGETNPYAALPRMVMLTYKIPESIQRIAKQGEFDEFDLNLFFAAEGKGEQARFKYEDYVQKWLDLIRGSYMETSVDELKLGAEKPPMPFSDTRLLNVLTHTLWFMPNVASCYAMANLLKQRQNNYYHQYTVNVCAGTEAGIGAAALPPVEKSFGDPLKTKTITLSCGKLTTGVTVKPWTGIFMLRNLSSPETYFQAAFRVQSPWEVHGEDGTKEIIKQECYVFDFALDRALRQISDYSCRLNIGENNPEIKVGEFVKFLPVLAYDGSAMRQVNAAEILDIAMAGTSATLLAKRWESALLVNVDNDTLSRLLANEEAMKALMSIVGFRTLNEDIRTIINKSEHVKQAKKEKEDLTPKEKKELSEEEKEYKSMRKKIQEKLIKFATRLPVFMYLTDYREFSLVDVITALEPSLFKKVTGLSVKDFELLVSLNVFNESLMNDAVYKFKRYEDASLTYTGIDSHARDTQVGLYSTTISREEYDAMAGLQRQSMQAPKPDYHDVPDKPYFAARSDDDEDEAESAKRPEPRYVEHKPITAEKPIVPPAAPKPAVTPTYRPAFVPPKPQTPAPKPAEPAKVDVSKVKVGAAVVHRAFGEGSVKEMYSDKNGNTYLRVSFGKEEKSFGFPGSFYQGFLRLKE